MTRPPGTGFRTATAIEEQAGLRRRLVIRPLPDDVRFVAGADVSCAFRGNTLWGGLAVCDLRDALRLVDSSVARQEGAFPYIPGLLGFREVPVLLRALEGLRVRPDVLLVDAQGIAHPRGLGSACHLGVASGIPSVGCAKSLLCGRHDAPGPERGEGAPILLEGEVVGTALRTRSGVRPVFVSPGHLADLSSCVALVLRCSPRYRIPVPVREAHALVNASRRGCTTSTEAP